ncbi:MAG: MMPL family transporter [Actinomycetota bacterium]|nr:MMPL family transporter [Actinomycetota bacterium]
MERWTRFVLRHRSAVLAAWVAALVPSLLAARELGDLLTNRFTLPGTDTHRAETILEQHFGQKTTGSFLLVAKGKPGSARTLVATVARAAQRAADAVPTAKVARVVPASDSVASALVVSNLEPADAKNYTDDVRSAAGSIPGGELYVTGQAAIERDLEPVFNRDLRIGELYVAIPIALVILAFVFGTLAFLLPFVFAAASIPTTLGILWLFARSMELSTYLQNMVMLIGLGIAIDYSLLVVYRYREELRAGRAKEEAILRTMETAGRAVVFSGTAVAIGLALMLFMPLPFMRGFGIGGLIIPLVSIVCALTLLPVLLYFLAARLDRVRLLPRLVIERREDDEQSFWGRLAHAIMRRPLVFAVGTAALLLALAAPVLDIELGPGSNKGIPQELEGMRGLNVISSAVGDGAIAPTVIVIDTHRSRGVDEPAVARALERLVARLRRDPEVAGVAFDPRGRQFVDPGRRYAQVQVTGESEYGVPSALEFVHRLRGDLLSGARFPPGVEVFAGGGPPSGVDFLDVTYDAFPWLVLAVLVLTYFLLLRAFRSLVLPLKAIVLNLLSIGAAYGLLVVVFKWGAAGTLGLISFDQVEGWIPVFLFAMLFGLSMDYEVFLVSRMREEWDAGRANEQAVSLGLAKTGRVVTAAGLVMFAAFLGFVAGSVVGLQQFGLGLAAAILIDVTIVRALLVPSAMKLFGRWNWWLPENVARVFRVKPSPLERRPLAAGARGR